MVAVAEEVGRRIHRDELDQSLGSDPFAYAAQTGRDDLEARFRAFAEGLPKDATGRIASAVLEARACPLCRDEGARPLFEKYGFTVRRCRCGFEHVAPILDQEQVAAGILDDPELSRAHLDFVSRPLYQACALLRFEYEVQALLDEWSEPRPPRRFLEIGASAGTGLDVARSYGLDTFGVEPNPDAARVAREKGHRILEATFGEGCLDEAGFDLAVTLDVLEHVPDPVSFLRAARRTLAPGGLLLVQVPNAGSLITWMKGAEDQIYNGLIHLNYFTGESLDRAAVKAGLEPVGTTSFLSELGKLRRYPEEEIRQVVRTRAPSLEPSFVLHQDWINDHLLGYKLMGIYRR